MVGCQTSVPLLRDDEALVRPMSPANLNLNLLSRAKDVRSQGVDQVGRHTITLLMIPGPTVTTETEHLDEGISRNVKAALELAGYSVRVVDHVDQARGPVLVVQIDDLRNYLFSWVYPIGVVWGKMELSLHLMNPDGSELWTGNAPGHGGFGGSLLYMAGFEGRVRRDLTANLNQVIEMVTSEEFKNAVRTAQAAR
jgi:hypothetical protein